MLKKKRLWEWGDKEAAYFELKEPFSSATVLKLPDPFKPFIMTTDWSQKGMGAVLS